MTKTEINRNDEIRSAKAGRVGDRFRASSFELHSSFRSRRSESASVLVIVLWVALGLISITIYFAGQMSMELHASDNRVSGLAAEQAIAGASRYVASLLANQINLGSNGVVPDPSTYYCEAARVGDAHYWLIGRDPNRTQPADKLSFGLVDEASRLNLNLASSNMLASLLYNLQMQNPNYDLIAGIVDWRSPNGGEFNSSYAALNPAYQAKTNLFETVDELRLVYGADLNTLLGEDDDRNGILDFNQKDKNHNGLLDQGMIEYLTVYTREPTTNSDGVARVNINPASAATLTQLLTTNLNSDRASQILSRLGLAAARGRTPASVPFASPLQFYQRSGMTADEFPKIANLLTCTNSAYIQGRVNINTASATVLACLPGISDNPGMEQTLISYRQNNPDRLGSVAWVVDALGQNASSALSSLAAKDCITTQSYQFTADIAAIGPYGRGYRRVRFVFDTSDGTANIVYRQDLSHLGWALGKDVRQTWLAANKYR